MSKIEEQLIEDIDRFFNTEFENPEHRNLAERLLSDRIGYFNNQ